MREIIDVAKLKSAEIRGQANIQGIDQVELLAVSRRGDRNISVYQFGNERVADVDGDSVWEELDPSAFLAVLREFGVNL